jgi:hypothetical protein
MIGRRAVVAGIGSMPTAPGLCGPRNRARLTLHMSEYSAPDRGRNMSRMVLVSLLPAALEDLGWIEGRTITFAWRFADGWSDRLTQLATDLVKNRVNVPLDVSLPFAR